MDNANGVILYFHRDTSPFIRVVANSTFDEKMATSMGKVCFVTPPSPS
jgi:hypothetical protein